MEIIIEQGNEFNYKIGKVDGEDIFINEYNQAALRLEEIVAATINYEKSIENNEKDSKANESDYLNNIIAFTGERGQGKSSAMHSFTQDLLDYKKKKESHIEYQEKTKTATFLKLDTIDPSTFEDMHNVLEVVIARMYNNLENEYSEGKDDKFKSRAKECKIFDSFQKVYELLSFIRNPKKLDGLENDYEGSLQKIARIGDSTNLKKEMQKLVKSYLELFLKDAENRFLIVPIDDLDINIKYAYKISEQIRKYLMIPHVVIIMAVKVEQLKQCIETVYRKQLEELIKAGERITKDEPVNMAAKYVEKLIPDGRKISLPEIRAISQSGKDAVKIVFLGKEVDSKNRDNKYKGKENILKDYKSNSGNSELGIEKTLLAYIYDKTGIVFVKPEITVHPIVPNTMRELVNLLSVLGKMEEEDKLDDKSDEIKVPKKFCPVCGGENKSGKLDEITVPIKFCPECGKKDESNSSKVIENRRLQNIKLFEDYFMHTWVPTNLDDGHVRTINELWNKSTFEKHQFICIKMMDMLERLDCYSVDKNPKELFNNENEEENKDEDEENFEPIKLLEMSISDLKSKFSKQNINCLSYSIGDVVSLIDVLSAIYIDKQVANFVFAVKTLYTITMHKLDFIEQSSSNEPSDIYKFIGGDLWGQTKKYAIRGGRGEFEFDTKSICKQLPKLGYYNKDFEIELDLLFYITFFSNYPSVKKGGNNAKGKELNKNIGEVILENKFFSGNKSFKKIAEFSIDNIFISAIDLNYTLERIGLDNINIECSNYNMETLVLDCDLLRKIAVNYELNESLKQYCIKTKDRNKLRDKKATAFEYAEHFINMVRDSLKKIDYISYFTKEYEIIPISSLKDAKEPEELGEVFVKLFESTIKKQLPSIEHRVTLNTKYADLKNYIDIIEKNYSSYKDEIANFTDRMEELNKIIGEEKDHNKEIADTLLTMYNSLANDLLNKIEINNKKAKQTEKLSKFKESLSSNSVFSTLKNNLEKMKNYIVHYKDINFIGIKEELESLYEISNGGKNQIGEKVSQRYTVLATKLNNKIEEYRRLQDGSDGKGNSPLEQKQGNSPLEEKQGNSPPEQQPPANDTPANTEPNNNSGSNQ